MLDSRNSGNNSNLVSENKSSLPNDNLNQDNSDLDDEIPLDFHGKKYCEKIFHLNPYLFKTR